MSVLKMEEQEIKNIDSKLDDILEWAKKNEACAEQLAYDSARLLACNPENWSRFQNQKFFHRCQDKFLGKSENSEGLDIKDLVQMQKMAIRYINLLPDAQLLMAHALIALKNNLNSLAIKEADTRKIINELAEHTQARFEKLENRIEQLEISTNLQGWLMALEESDYIEKFPTEYIRLLHVINDFYSIKNNNWNSTDLKFMRKAIRTINLDPKQNISLETFINKLIDEIHIKKNGYYNYKKEVTKFEPDGVTDYSQYVVDNISSPVFASLHRLKSHYSDRLDMVEALENEMKISKSEALKILLRRSITNMNVKLESDFPLAETAIEILGCLRLAEQLASNNSDNLNIKKEDTALNNTSETISNSNSSDISDHQDEHDNLYRENETIILEAFKEIANKYKSELYIKGMESKAKINKKIKAALSAFAPFVNLEDILVYYDSTMFGGGDEGFIMTNDAVYGENGVVLYDGIDNIISKWSGFVIESDGRKIDFSCSAGAVRDKFISTMQMLKNV